MRYRTVQAASMWFVEDRQEGTLYPCSNRWDAKRIAGEMEACRAKLLTIANPRSRDRLYQYVRRAGPWRRLHA